MRWGRKPQLATVIILFISYAFLAHYTNSTPHAQDLGAVIALAPLVSIGCILIWRWVNAAAAGGFAVIVAALLYRFWPLFQKSFSAVYLLQECGFYLLMAASFGQSVRPGRIALCTHFADKVHGPLSAREVQYTRHVTVAWALFFLVLAVTTVTIYATAPLKSWSFFANFCALPLIGVMFAAEYAVRRKLQPQIKRTGILASVKVYFAESP